METVNFTDEIVNTTDGIANTTDEDREFYGWNREHNGWKFIEPERGVVRREDERVPDVDVLGVRMAGFENNVGEVAGRQPGHQVHVAGVKADAWGKEGSEVKEGSRGQN
jgi:hypothetical protein